MPKMDEALLTDVIWLGNAKLETNAPGGDREDELTPEEYYFE